MNQNEYKKELLYRKVNGKRFIESYLSKISSLLNCDITNVALIPLDTTDKILKDSLINHAKSKNERIEPQSLSMSIKSLKKYNSEYYVFIDDDWKYCGAFITPSLSLLKDNFQFGEAIINNILLISKNLAHVVDIDYYEINGRYYIDIKESSSE